MAIHIHRIQIGHSTNSSSMHSLVIKTEGHEIKDDDNEQSFGWGQFTVASSQQKGAYLAHTIANQIVDHGWMFGNHPLKMAEGVVQDIIREGTGQEVQIEADPDGYIDHQSVLTLVTKNGGTEKKRFLHDAVNFIMDPRVVILGGSDQDDSPHPLAGGTTEEFVPSTFFRETTDDYILRYDARDSYWSVWFQHRGGSAEVTNIKFRWAVDPGPMIVRSEVPELVDMSIGNHCTTGCKYCYRGSLPGLGWASEAIIVELCRNLYSMGTEEIALGGGDPMQHPEIDSIVSKVRATDSLKKLYVTTRELDWLSNAERVTLHSNHVTAWGVSVDNLSGTKRAIEAFKKAGVSRSRLTLQIVVGAVGEKVIREILSYLSKLDYKDHPKILLLGYKNTGFGNQMVPKPVSPTILKGDSAWNVGIDTALAKEWKSWLEVNAWKGSYHTQDGGFSCFIDAQKMRLYSSSFDQSEGFPIEFNLKGKYLSVPEKAIRSAFQTMQDSIGLGGSGSEETQTH